MALGRIVLVLGLAVYGLAAAGSGIDRMSLARPAVERVVPGPFRAQADRSAATTDLVRQNYKAMLVHARRATKEDPVDIDPTALLGSALALNGQDDAAAQAFRLAARFGWRNAATQVYWYDAALGVGEFERASERADALLRVHPRLVDSAELLEPLERSPRGRTVLAERLSQNPPWQENYLFLRLDSSPDLVSRRFQVLSAIAPGHPLGCEAVARFTSVLVHQGRRNDAVALWNRNCPASAVHGPMTDLTFRTVQTSASDQPFAWLVTPSGDLTIRQNGSTGAPPSLELSNSASGSLLVLSQSVSFPPGTYRFRATAAPGSTSGAGKLALSWVCGDQLPFPRAGQGDPLQDGQVVQIGACDRQLLGLWLGGGGSVKLRSISFEKVA